MLKKQKYSVKKAIEKIGRIFEGILRSHTLMLDEH
ncbi:MAG: hypothetical protein ACI8YO_000357 [Gammaproteobacteria bacterium]